MLYRDRNDPIRDGQILIVSEKVQEPLTHEDLNK